MEEWPMTPNQFKWRMPFVPEEEKHIWHTILHQMRNIDNISFPSPKIKEKAKDPLSATFWRIAKENDPSLTRGYNVYINKLRRMWLRKEFHNMSPEDVLFLSGRLNITSPADSSPSSANTSFPTPQMDFEQKIMKNGLLRLLQFYDPVLCAEFVEITAQVNSHLEKVVKDYGMPVPLPPRPQSLPVVSHPEIEVITID